MKSILIYFCTSLIFVGASAQSSSLKLWYDKPAKVWEEYLPLGNGRLGAMPDGGVLKENIVLNDITLWSGGVQDADKKGAYQYLAEIQRLLFEGKNIEAQELMSHHYVCEGEGSGHGKGANVPYGSYQVLGDLSIQYHYGIDSSDITVKKYKRELSLQNAAATTSFGIGSTVYSREYFTSFADDVIAIRLAANQVNKINFSLGLSRPERFETTITGNEMQMVGQMNNGTDGNGMKYIVRVRIQPEGGKLVSENNTLRLEDANAAVIYISAGTDYKNTAYLNTTKTILDKAIKKAYSTLRKEHRANYQRLFGRAVLNLEGTQKDNLPTDKRLAEFVSDRTDNGLPVLYYQYGRYLLICSTRPGLLPPNLQGLWANTINTPWNGDYHLDINIQMNHWPLEVTNLSMLNEPFYTLVKGLVEPGEKTAKAYYNAPGWVAHVITNIWGYTSPGEHYSWGATNTGSAWLCQMLWNHYEFTGDTSYLKKLYPILKGSARFYLSMLVKEPSHGWLVTAPSNSPENAFILPNGKHANVCEGPTLDNQLIRHLFSTTIESCKKLGVDETLKEDLEKAVTQLPPNQIGKDGRLMEWLKEYKEAEPHHRHVSHLWGLYPGDEINATTPELKEAARASLEARGDDGTGWSLAWKVNFWARLHDGNRAFELLHKLLRPVTFTGYNMSNGGGTYGNLFCAHPPFQIDGNFGGTAGIAEMLIQSHNGYIELLPALPDEWKSGSFAGFCVRGGAEVSAKWTNGKVGKIVLKATTANTFKIKIPAGISPENIIRKGKQGDVSSADGLITVFLKKGETLEVTFK